MCEAIVCLFTASRNWNWTNPLRTHLGTGDQMLNPCNSTKLMILSDLKQLKNQLLKLLLNFSAIWKVVKTQLISGTQSGGYVPPSPTIARYCNRCTLGVTMLPVPGVSKEQQRPDFQKYQYQFWSCPGDWRITAKWRDIWWFRPWTGKECGKQQIRTEHAQERHLRALLPNSPYHRKDCSW